MYIHIHILYFLLSKRPDEDCFCSLQVHIGIYLKPFLIGHVTYKTSFFDNPKAKWGVVGGCIVVVLAVITVIAVKINNQEYRDEPSLCRKSE